MRALSLVGLTGPHI